MNATIRLLLAFFAGAGIGVVFYGGLWLTVSRIHSASHPVLLVATSFIVRTVMALTGIWFVSAGGDLGRLASCFGGFIVGRLLILWTTRSSTRT